MTGLCHLEEFTKPDHDLISDVTTDALCFELPLKLQISGELVWLIAKLDLLAWLL